MPSYHQHGGLSKLPPPAGFYSGPVAAAIAEAVLSRPGVLTEGDLAAHRSAVVPPISTVYKGHRVYEVPPPTQVRRADIRRRLLHSETVCKLITAAQHRELRSETTASAESGRALRTSTVSSTGHDCLCLVCISSPPTATFTED